MWVKQESRWETPVGSSSVLSMVNMNHLLSGINPDGTLPKKELSEKEKEE